MKKFEKIFKLYKNKITRNHLIMNNITTNFSKCVMNKFLLHANKHLKDDSQKTVIKDLIESYINDISNTENTSIIEDINYDIFYNTSTREDNDETNKKREDILVDLIDNKIDLINDCDKKKNIYNNLTKTLNELCDELGIKCNKYKLIKIAGSKNYDFDFKCYNDNNCVSKKDLEFKFSGKQSSISSLAQFHSPHVISGGNLALVNNTTNGYHEYFYNHFNEFFESFPESIKIKLKEYKPNTLNEYISIINTVPSKNTHYNNKSLFLQTIYDYRNNPDKDFDKDFKQDKNGHYKNLKFQNYVNKTIKDYLSTIKKSNIDFSKVNNMLKKQKEKIFLHCSKGNFNYDKFTKDQLIIKEDKIDIINNNLIRFYCNDNKYCIDALLRWRNTHGCSNPMFQLSLNNNNEYKVKVKDK